MRGEDTHYKKTKKRGDVISKQVKVADCDGRTMEPTYYKRAWQLVKSGRADWVGKNAIQLINRIKEDKAIMNINEMNPEVFKDPPGIIFADNGPRIFPAPAVPSMDMDTEKSFEKKSEAAPIKDRDLMELAKRRLATKRNIIGQVWDFALIVFVMIVEISLWDTDERLVLGFVFCAFWGIRLLYRIYKYFKPLFRDGISAYFHEREQRMIQSEYNRLRKKREDYLSDEFI